MLKSLAMLAFAALWITAAHAGSIDPPGTPTPTMVTLDELAAADGDVTLIDSLPVEITAPGHYRVTQNLTGVVSEEGIFILTDDVTLDLGGFTLTGVPGALSGIAVSGEFGGPDFVAREGITIQNGHLRGWGSAGINALLSNGVVIRNISSNRNLGLGIVGGLGARIERCSASGNQLGIGAFNSAIISQCTAISNEIIGIAGAPGSTVSQCIAFFNGDTGINAAESSVVVNCTVSNNGTMGAGGGTGINASLGVTVRSCTAINNEDAGIEVGNDCLIVGNTCTDNDFGSNGTGAGILVTGSRSRIEDNVCNSNVRGIDVDGFDNLIVRNRAAGNTGSGSPSANFTVSAGTNQLGPIVTTNGTIATNSPWANFER